MCLRYYLSHTIQAYHCTNAVFYPSVDSNGPPILDPRWREVLLVLTRQTLVYVGLQLYRLLYAWFNTATVLSCGQAAVPQPLQGIRTACKHQDTLHMVTGSTACR